MTRNAHFSGPGSCELKVSGHWLWGLTLLMQGGPGLSEFFGTWDTSYEIPWPGTFPLSKLC